MDSIRNRDRVKIAHRPPSIWRLACHRVALALLLVCAPAFAAPKPKAPALTLAYDRAPAACHYLLNLYNRDFARKGYVDTRAHRVFRAIHWVRLRGPVILRTGVVIPNDARANIDDVASFDLTNDGYPEPVLREFYLVGNPGDGNEDLYLLRTAPRDAEAWHRLERDPKRFAGDVRAALQSPRYTLKHLPLERRGPYRGMHPSILTALAFHPLRLHDATYVSVSAYADHGRIAVGEWFNQWIVIGQFRPDDRFHDVCYFKSRVAAAPVYRR
ncbi:MAG: hypothetical protein ACYCVY_11250 [Acidiferrobacteraceae bacterium]